MSVLTNESECPSEPIASASQYGRDEGLRPLSQLRKRKRGSRQMEDQDLAPQQEGSRAITPEHAQTKVNIEYPLKHISPPPLVYPKSLYADHDTVSPRSSENEMLLAITKDLVSEEEEGSETFLEAEIDEYCVYRPHAARLVKSRSDLREAALSNSLVCLQDINESSVQHFLFDGTVHLEGKYYRLEHVPFTLLSIGGLEDVQSSTVGNNLWIQSSTGKEYGVWYRLGRPAPEYQRYDDNFRWMADLAKYVIDFIASKPNTRLLHFQVEFCEWLKGAYAEEKTITKWLSCYGDSDFRRLIANQATFLYCQATQVNSDHNNIPLWSEVCHHILEHIPIQVEDQSFYQSERFLTGSDGGNKRQRKTTVTPYAFDCFRHLPWQKMLYPQTFEVFPKGQTLRDSQISEHDSFHAQTLVISHRPALPETPTSGENISIGDVVSVAADAHGAWKHQGTEWYAYVQDIKAADKGQRLSLIWLYRPSDTACMKMRYPFENELFLSDHCNCGDHPIYDNEVIRKPEVAFYGSPEMSGKEFCCRQRYCEADSAWTTLKHSDFTCPCRSSKASKRYSPGQTILWKPRSYKRRLLEPAIVIGHDPHDPNRVKVRTLLRRKRDFGIIEAAPNELVYMQRFENIEVKRIENACHIRFFHNRLRDEGAIPTPYDRNGTGNYWYICCAQIEEACKDLPASWQPDFDQGWDPATIAACEPMKALDIFCGGGNFGRGMEEAGIVKCQWAVDYFSEAIHSYHANLSADSDVKLYHGSVNDYLSKAMDGNFQSGLIARPGEVVIIIAGSPCQGFSNMNPNKGSLKGLINESMVASVVAYIDFYRPKHAILENVKGMAAGGEENNVLSAVLCALVGLGYQVRTFALDAWSFGAPESRTRIFISCAAPGQPPMPEPVVTHSHPEGTLGGSLGRTANGLTTGARYEVPTAFDFIPAQEATSDLPAVDPGLTSIAFPDHREPIAMSVLDRNRISSIPKYPGGCGFLAAHRRGMMPTPQVEDFAWDKHIRAGKYSTAWSRFRGDRLFNTILTRLNPWDGINGTSIHWEEHRLLSILEARRAQGFLDRDVIVGKIGDQWKIVGNSVARPVALALGLALREAWLRSFELDPDSNLIKVEQENSLDGVFPAPTKDSRRDGSHNVVDHTSPGLLQPTPQYKLEIEATLNRHLQKLQNLWTTAIA